MVKIEDLITTTETLEQLRDVLPKQETTDILTTIHTIIRNARDLSDGE